MPLPITYPLGGLAPEVQFDARDYVLKALERILLEVLGEDEMKHCRRDVIEGNPAEVLIRLSD